MRWGMANPGVAPKAPLAVVVTADDFGIGRRTSEGIIKAHLEGPVTATSLIAITGEHLLASIPLLANAPNLDVGLHLVLTHCGHNPLTAKRSSGLVGRDGCFHSNSRLWVKSFSGGLSRTAVAEEMAAQSAMFDKLLGRPPTHVDCHHHAHQLPTICEALVEVIAAGLLPAVTRTTIEPPGVLPNVSGVRLKRLAAKLIGQRSAELFAAHHIRHNDFFIGMLAPHGLTKSLQWQHFLDRLPPAGIVEWIVHPGLPDETLTGRDDYADQRVDELESLTLPPGNVVWQRIRPLLTRKSLLIPRGTDAPHKCGG